MTGAEDQIDHGAALTAFLESEWRLLGTNRGRWCRENGLSDSTVLRWSQGPTNIDMNQLELVARALHRPLVQVLLAARYLTPEQVNGQRVEPRPPPSVEDAIRLDPTLDDTMREALSGVLRALRQIASGAVAAASSPPARRRRRQTGA